jgi:hypothetical protein
MSETVPGDSASDQPDENTRSRYERYKLLFDPIRRDLDQLWTSNSPECGKVAEARRLGSEIGQPLSDDLMPCYYFGNVDAPLVMVNLNAEQRDTTSSSRSVFGHPWPRNIQEYDNFFGLFGTRVYGPAASRQPTPFDELKLLPFIRGLGAIDLVDKLDGKEEPLENLARCLDRKLQLELVPYSSATFDTQGAWRSRHALRPYMERILNVISTVPRRQIIFTSRFFERWFRESGVAWQLARFVLPKADGRSSSPFLFARGEYEWNGAVLQIAVAPTNGSVRVRLSRPPEVDSRRAGLN